MLQPVVHRHTACIECMQFDMGPHTIIDFTWVDKFMVAQVTDGVIIMA